MRIVPVLTVLAGGALIAAAATGITYAATRDGDSVHACANSKGTLRLLNAHGHCPKHYSKVTLNEQGPRGKTGKTGKTGPPGPGAIRLAVSSTSGLSKQESTQIAGSTLTVEVLCSPADDAQVYINADGAGAPWTFEGNASGTAGSATLLYENPNGSPAPTQQIAQTAEIVAGEQGGDAHSVEFTTDADTLEASVLVAQGDHMFTVQLGAYVAEDDSSCWAHALVTPAD